MPWAPGWTCWESRYVKINDVLLVKMKGPVWYTIYIHLSSFTCCFLWGSFNPHFFHQPMGIFVGTSMDGFNMLKNRESLQLDFARNPTESQGTRARLLKCAAVSSASSLGRKMLEFTSQDAGFLPQISGDFTV